MESNEENEYRNKLSVSAKCLSDKMAVLEARDRLMRLKRMRQTDLATAVAVVGTCPDMCPELERYFRQETNQVSLFEMDVNTGQPDEHRMVKEYRRSGADQEEPLAHDLRPTPVLNRTMDYLCTNIMDSLDVNSSCGEWYDFVWSRTRSIRKDITQQHLCDQQVVALTEKCARFHIHCSATLCEQNLKDFDPKINEENLSNCLQSLKDLYYDLSLRDIFCPNECEFRCYEILLHLNDTAILKDVQNYRPETRNSNAVQIGIKAFFAYQSNNYIKFFGLLNQCSYLMSCILHRYFTPIRQKAFRILRKCYTSNSSSVQEYPEQSLISSLGFEDSDELKTFCDHIGLECEHGFVSLVRGQNQNNTLKAKRSLRLVESKRVFSVGEVISGTPLPTNPYKTTEVHNSFDSEGRLKTHAIEALDQKTKTMVFNESLSQMREPLNSLAETQKYTFSSVSPFSGALTPQTNSFAFSKMSFPSAKSSTLFPNNFETKLKPKSSSNVFMDKITSNDVSDQISDDFLAIYEEITEDIIEEIVEKELTDICSSQMEAIINQMLEKTICDIFSDIFLKTCHQLIEEISLETIERERALRAQQIKAVDHLSANIFDDLLFSEIISISSEVLIKSKDEFIEKQNILIANQLLNLFIDELVKEIASEVISDETHIRETLMGLIREKRIKSLQTKYFFQWKQWFLRRKRLRYWSQSFPAAPKWGPTKAVPNIALHTFTDLSSSDRFNLSIKRELLVNNSLNLMIDKIIKEIASEVFQTSVSQKTQYFDYFQQKRKKRIESKYFSKWRQFCAQKRQHLKRDRFPAAPNWSSKALKYNTKHTISSLDEITEVMPKRLCRQLESDLISQSNQSVSESVVNIKPLFDTELSESKQLTQRLIKEVNGQQNMQLINQFMDTNTESGAHEEEDEDIQVIQVFESEADKMKRLKRLLSEEKDYFSLHNFVEYLHKNN